MAFSIEKVDFDKFTDENNEEVVVHKYICSNNHGFILELLDFGARIYSFKCPPSDPKGEPEELLLQHKYLPDIVEDRDAYFGCTVGRYANRIANGKFVLDGVAYQLAINNGPNHLHGGKNGFDRRMWDCNEIINGHEVGVEFCYISADGEENYPGTLTVFARYTLTSDDELVMEFTANTDKPTIVNLTNHGYWNLSGKITEQDISEHSLKLNCKKYCPVGDNMIPTGELEDCTGNMDFSSPKKMSAVFDTISIDTKKGLDHCFVVDRTGINFPDDLAEVGELSCGDRKLKISTNQLGIQFYTGNWLKGTDKSGRPNHLKEHQGIAIEPQIFPNSINAPRFPTPILRPGKEYHHLSIYKFEGFPVESQEEEDDDESQEEEETA